MTTDRPSPPHDAPTDRPATAPGPAPSPSSRPAPRGAVLCGIAALSGFIFYQSPSLWDEVQALRGDLSRSRNNAIIGYVGISPSPSKAQPPGDWFLVEGERARLWGGWHDRLGHRWFDVRSGDLDPSSITELIGRDMFQGIDRPIVEPVGGPVSRRIPAEHEVDAMVFEGRAYAYPTLVLDKVLLVNDELDGHPLLVLYAHRADGGSSVFSPVLDGRRIRMGFAGYIYRGRPLLYDRATEALWVEQEQGLVSLSGPDRGRILKRLGRMQRGPWGSWSDRHKGGRVLVGADRSVGTASL